ncbi:Ras-related protein Rab-15 [Tritrichomonas foetus]|uniref:Ras-related protein Rab-15 n=1 Tax=Tritrichomonas foetus TaxID=1144522 RepID=A0A1J4KAE0_9EUKA|nr:Ras-related protein Rab-15 [Tritrichomonas foetus]|eukprot:OHT08391.1 Ras-related protein Rab-15 [Tritrichomonas foetus]
MKSHRSKHSSLLGNQQDKSLHYKIVMVGNSGVGKTALVEKLSGNNFSDTHIPTVGAQFTSKETIINEHKVSLELWDTAGQEVFRSLVGLYTREANGAFLLFDITSKLSYDDIPKWLDFLKENAPTAKIVIFGNKSDISEQREVSETEIQKFVEENQFIYFEGSAKTGLNVNDAFERMAEIVLEGDITKKRMENKKLKVDNQNEGSQKCCL